MIQFLMTMIAGQKAKMDERGASAVEYGLLVAGIAAVIVAIVITLGGQINDAFTDTSDQIDGIGGTAG
ncbi:pilus assembly protein Flp/PilA [Nocardioides marinisabuli]|uniref:Pilus assembly protein Flp/PilA n=1 Tax=Nocardioides marinisabuli TaxID=419476 RepID=A0A7Y9F2K1_9ACTN|nr:Flp family type IVb pilin [Nocardioides marinisabuli]NYD58453.1 pilus assembly protein Flp/PilA [Nocardioides marinisabuli]